ncbi:MAG: alginate export family protein [Pseudomonadales bacterium]|nr:alginate export family protein [Pseudomonadales bacterium]
MRKPAASILGLAVTSALILQPSTSNAQNITDAITNGKANVDLRLRYEAVEQDNNAKDASALTLRSRLGYTTSAYEGFSATAEFEDVRVVGSQDDYSVPQTNFQTNAFSVIADPSVTELDQGFLQYANKDLKLKAGRQVLTYDNHRYVGHVGWRQDRQTFDGISATITPTKELKLNGAYLNQRNRIFAEAKDVTSKDILLNASYSLQHGTITGYGYLLEVDDSTDNSLDTFGLRFSGSTNASNTKILYTAEFATQENEAGGSTSDANYLFLEGGVVASGITAKLGYEVLSSDDSNYGFSTPLATGHKFNGWSDQFLGTPTQGLVDLTITVSGKAGGGKWLAAYHDFSADQSTSTVDDLGSELNLLYAKKFGKHYNTGVKYATYSAGDAAAGKVDTNKLWAWVGMKF